MGMTTEIHEEVDAKMDLMNLNGSRKTLNWPTVSDTCYMLFDDTLPAIPTKTIKCTILFLRVPTKKPL